MKFVKFWIAGIIGMAVSVSLLSCGGDDSDPGSVGNDESALSGDKGFMEQTARMLLNKFNASDQREVITMVNQFLEDFDYYDFPDEFVSPGSSEEKTSPARQMMRSLSTALCSGRYYDIAKAYTVYTYAFGDFRGVYEPDHQNEIWVKTASSNDVVFRYNDRMGRLCEVVAKASSTSYTGEIVLDYDTYRATVPSEINVTVTRGGTVMASASIKSSYVRGSKLDLSVNATAANIAVLWESHVTDRTFNGLNRVSVSGEVVVSSEALATGANMCNQDYIQSLIENDEAEKLYDLVDCAEASTDVLGRVQISAETSALGQLADAIGYHRSDYDDPDAQKGARQAASRLNVNLPARFRFDYEAESRGSITWKAVIAYEWYSSWDHITYRTWEVEPVLNFNDGTSYEFSQYFGDGSFGNVENTFTSLYDAYEALWK